MTMMPPFENYATNPYFLNAFYSPNFNAGYAQQNKSTNTAQSTPDASKITTEKEIKGVNPQFKGSAEEIAATQSGKKSNGAAWLITLLCTAGTIFAGWKCHGKGSGDEILTKTLNGAKQYWNQAIEKIGKWKFSI